MSHRFVHHVAITRAQRGLSRHARRVLHQQHKRQVKRETFRDCGRRCVYCGTALGLANATLDHVIPLSRGGSHLPGNLVSAWLPTEFFARYPVAGQNFMRLARAVHRQLKRGARRAVAMYFAADAA